MDKIRSFCPTSEWIYIHIIIFHFQIILQMVRVSSSFDGRLVLPRNTRPRRPPRRGQELLGSDGRGSRSVDPERAQCRTVTWSSWYHWHKEREWRLETLTWVYGFIFLFCAQRVSMLPGFFLGILDTVFLYWILRVWWKIMRETIRIVYCIWNSWFWNILRTKKYYENKSVFFNNL